MDKLDKKIDSLIDSYDAYGMVNHSGGANLPGSESIASIVQGLDGLLFPGFHENHSLDHDKLRLITAEKVNRLARLLSGEVEKSLVFYKRSCGKRSGASHCTSKDCQAEAERIVGIFFDELPAIRKTLSLDMEAGFKGDPAAKNEEEVILSYPGFQAITVQRLAHFFWKAKVPLIPRMMSELIHSRTGIDVHPGAEIGDSFFIDHGTGVVIGETAVIGKNVKIYQGVTLGAISVRKGEGGVKRHPTIEDDVTIYANATILGGETVIGHGSIIGGSVWITESVPPLSKIYIKSEK